MTDIMQKSNLKNRMIVQLNSGVMLMVIGDALVGEKGIIPLKEFTDDLKSKDINDKLGDVCCVYSQRFCLSTNIVGGELPIWMRPKESEEPKEITLDEIEKKLGCKIKIVNEKG